MEFYVTNSIAFHQDLIHDASVEAKCCTSCGLPKNVN